MTEREKIDSWLDGLDEYGEKIEDYGYWRADLRIKATIADELKRQNGLLEQLISKPQATTSPVPKPPKKSKGMGNCGMCKYWKRESTDGTMICINPQSPMCGDWVGNEEGCSCYESDD